MSKGVLMLVVVVTCLLGGVFFFQLKKTGDDFSELIANGAETSGVVTNIYRGIEYQYEVGGNTFSRRKSAYPRNIVSGEEFLVLYSKENFGKSIIDFYNPIIDTPKFDLVCVSNVEVVNGKEKGLVYYEYDFHGVTHGRYQRFIHSKLPSNREVMAFVKVDNPGISYLTFEVCTTQ